MKKIFATLALTGLVLLSLIFGNDTRAQEPPDNVAGSWTIYSTSIETGEIVIKHVQIAQYGTRITGYFEGPEQSGPIEGEVDVHHIRFSTVTRNVLTFRGQIYGDNITGSFGIHGRHAAWQAVRTPPVAQQVPPSIGAVYTAQPVLPPPAPATAPAPASYQTAPAPAPAPAPDASAQPATATTTQTSSSSNPAPQTPEELQALVAPIALYPDALVAQILAAASYPEQAAFADYWLAQNKTLTGTALSQAVDQEPWDPSVKALTQFPAVLHTLASNLTWTSNLGEAFHNQQPDVMAAIQVMRAKAQAAGNLQSTPQIQVVQQSPSTIVIQPANPEVVYVPQYNPAVVFGVSYVVPAYTPPVVFGGVGLGISFGAGVAVGAVFGGGGFVGGGVGFGWGWHAWGCNWGGGGGGGGTVIYNHNTYINNTTNIHNWHGANYNDYHPWGPANRGNGPYAPHRYDPNGWQPNGGRNGDHGLIGGNGGVEHGPDGGRNGNGGLIGGQGGVRDRNAGMNGPGVAPNGGYHDRGGMSGDGRASREESNRGRYSMNRGSEIRASREHGSAPHHEGGGERRR